MRLFDRNEPCTRRLDIGLPYRRGEIVCREYAGRAFDGSNETACEDRRARSLIADDMRTLRRDDFVAGTAVNADAAPRPELRVDRNRLCDHLCCGTRSLEQRGDPAPNEPGRGGRALAECGSAEVRKCGSAEVRWAAIRKCGNAAVLPGVGSRGRQWADGPFRTSALPHSFIPFLE
jgi:hypothetical protein